MVMSIRPTLREGRQNVTDSSETFSAWRNPMERILRRSLVEIAMKAAPARKKSRRARDIYLIASVALEIAMMIDKGRMRYAR